MGLSDYHDNEVARGISLKECAVEAHNERNIESPRYCVVGARPIKAIEAKDSGMDVLAFDWSTGEFARDMNYLTRVILPDEEVEIISAHEFDAYVAELRSGLK